MSTTTTAPQDFRTTLDQIGFMNVLAISGGKSFKDGNDLILPVSHGYVVRVALDWSDTYTVTREFHRAGKVVVKGKQSDVYFDELGEVAYRASCFRNGEWNPDEGVQWS